jgi:hypothetical protein
VTCLTEGNDRIRDTAGNNYKLVHNRIQDTVAPFLVTTIGLYGYEANNGIRDYMATSQSVSGIGVSESTPMRAGSRRRRQLVAGVRSAQPSK